MTTLVPVHRKKQKSEQKNISGPSGKPLISNKCEDLSKIIVMSGSAKRKSLSEFADCQHEGEKEDKIESTFKFPRKNSYWNESLKLRNPCPKINPKNAQVSENWTSRSCKILFEYLKPYENISSRNGKIRIVHASQCIRSILKTNDFKQETKATRKVQFLSVWEETPIPHFVGANPMSEPINDATGEIGDLDLFDLNEAVGDVSDQVKEKRTGRSQIRGKTVSSEDFINNVFVARETPTLENGERKQQTDEILQT